MFFGSQKTPLKITLLKGHFMTSPFNPIFGGFPLIFQNSGHSGWLSFLATQNKSLEAFWCGWEIITQFDLRDSIKVVLGDHVKIIFKESLEGFWMFTT